MKFPKTIGTIDFVAPEHYQSLIDDYVKKVSQLDGVQGIVLFGSVSTPGLSDIDLVVTVPDDGPWPRWQEMSLKHIATGHPAESVVAHDVFVWPESVSRKAESFFYIDQQTVLHGDRLGGACDPALMNSFRELLTMDYLLHRFESLASLLWADKIGLRPVLLFISTFRHTCHLASELGLMTTAESSGLVADINALRKMGVSDEFSDECLAGWPERLIRLLWKTTSALADRMGLNEPPQQLKWQPNPRTVFLNSNSSDGVKEWQKCTELQQGHFLSKRCRAIPVPGVILNHVQSYCNSQTDSGRYLRTQFPQVFKTRNNSGISKARDIRVDAVMRHWELLRSANFMNSSGKGYMGVAMPGKRTFKTKLISGLAKLNAVSISKELIASP